MYSDDCKSLADVKELEDGKIGIVAKVQHIYVNYLQ